MSPTSLLVGLLSFMSQANMRRQIGIRDQYWAIGSLPFHLDFRNRKGHEVYTVPACPDLLIPKCRLRQTPTRAFRLFSGFRNRAFQYWAHDLFVELQLSIFADLALRQRRTASTLFPLSHLVEDKGRRSLSLESSVVGNQEDQNVHPKCSFPRLPISDIRRRPISS